MKFTRYKEGENKKFVNNRIELQKGDSLYIFSDGFADQFGGPNGKKFMVGNFRKLLVQIAGMSSEAQKEYLDETLLKWQGGQEQVDDVLVIGLKV